MAATQAQAGYKGTIALSTAVSGAVTQIAEIVDFNLHTAHRVIEATNHDSSGETERIAGFTEWDGDLEFQFIDDAASQTPLFDILTGKIKIDFSFEPVGTTSGDHWTGSGFLTDWTLANPGEDTTNISASFEGDRTLTYTSSTG